MKHLADLLKVRRRIPQLQRERPNIHFRQRHDAEQRPRHPSSHSGGFHGLAFQEKNCEQHQSESIEHRRAVPDRAISHACEERYHHTGNSFDPKPLPPRPVNGEAQQQDCENSKTQIIT